MYQHHFGMTQAPLDKNNQDLWDDGYLQPLVERFGWLLKSPGVGLLIGDVGVGKTAALRQMTQSLNPHRYQVIYLAETDFGRADLYRGLALALGLEPVYRRAQLWRDIKARIHELSRQKNRLPLWIIDEAQNLPQTFFRDLPSFLNFAFDTEDLMSVWLVGLPSLAYTLERAPYAALASRIQVRLKLEPIQSRERFAALIEHALKAVGCQQPLMSDSGLEYLRQAAQGSPRQAGTILRHALRLAVPKQLNHLPDELIQQAIKEQRL